MSFTYITEPLSNISLLRPGRLQVPGTSNFITYVRPEDADALGLSNIVVYDSNGAPQDVMLDLLPLFTLPVMNVAQTRIGTLESNLSGGSIVPASVSTSNLVTSNATVTNVFNAATGNVNAFAASNATFATSLRGPTATFSNASASNLTVTGTVNTATANVNAFAASNATFATSLRGPTATFSNASSSNLTVTGTATFNDVGIGTSTPAFELDVTGNSRVTGRGNFSNVSTSNLLLDSASSNDALITFANTLDIVGKGISPPSFSLIPPVALTGSNNTVVNQGLASGSYNLTFSTQIDQFQAFFQAFDNNDGSSWFTADRYNGSTGVYIGSLSTIVSGITVLGEWISLQMPMALNVTSYQFLTNTSSVSSFLLAGSTNGTTWTQVDSQTGFSASTKTTFAVAGSEAYTHLRFIVRATRVGKARAEIQTISYAGTVGPSVPRTVRVLDNLQTSNITCSNLEIGNTSANNLTVTGVTNSATANVNAFAASNATFATSLRGPTATLSNVSASNLTVSGNATSATANVDILTASSQVITPTLLSTVGARIGPDQGSVPFVLEVNNTGRIPVLTTSNVTACNATVASVLNANTLLASNIGVRSSNTPYSLYIRRATSQTSGGIGDNFNNVFLPVLIEAFADTVPVQNGYGAGIGFAASRTLGQSDPSYRPTSYINTVLVSGANTTSDTWGMQFWNRNNDVYVNAMNISPEGRVGIGTSSPTGSLHVNNNVQPAVVMTGGATGGKGSTISLVGAGGVGSFVGIEMSPFDNGTSVPSAQIRATDIDFGAYLDVMVRPVGSGNVNSPANTMIRARPDGVVINGTQNEASAVMTVNSTTQGIVIPRMTSAQREAIASPAAGLQVFDTDRSALYMFTGAFWSIFPVTRQVISPIGSAVADTETAVNGVRFRYSNNGNNGQLQVQSDTSASKILMSAMHEVRNGATTSTVTTGSRFSASPTGWSTVDIRGLGSRESALVDIVEPDTGINWRIRITNNDGQSIILRIESF